MPSVVGIRVKDEHVEHRRNIQSKELGFAPPIDKLIGRKSKSIPKTKQQTVQKSVASQVATAFELDTV